MRRLMMRSVTAIGLASLLTGLSMAQEMRSTILGRVLDPQNQAVVGSAVTVTNTTTNVTVRLQTNATGYYEASLLLPGQYEVRASAAGFKESVRGGIALLGGRRLEVDIQLELGAITESVSVSAESQILETSGVSGGRVMDSKTLRDIPIFYSNPVDLIRFTPGVFTGGQNSRTNALHATGGFVATSIGGGVGNNAVSLDGAPNMRRAYPGDAPSYNPHSDTLQEVKIETFNFDASVGHTTGINVQMLTKVGTNDFHGTLSDQHWQQRWNATPFFVKQQYYRSIAQAEAQGDTARANFLRHEQKQPSGHSNTYNGGIGGPVILPKLFNGKDKLFFFFSYSGTKLRSVATPGQINRTVPTMMERDGDFSDLLKIDPKGYQMYDPLSIRSDPARPTHYIRTPFSGNIIPESRRINPAYKTYLGFLPTPNNNPINPLAEPNNNYLASKMGMTWDYGAFSNRFDYQHSNKHRFFFRWALRDHVEKGMDWLYETAGKGITEAVWHEWSEGATFDWVYLINSSTVLNLTTSDNYYTGDNSPPAAARQKPSSFGLPAYLDQKAEDLAVVPTMAINNYFSLGPYGGGWQQSGHNRLASSSANLSHVRGHHTLRGGFDMRQYYNTSTRGGNTSGNFSFGGNFLQQNDDGFTPIRRLGFGWAAFMMGLPSGMTIDTNDTFVMHSPSYGWFLQDDFRVTPRLTLNLGLRIEYEQGPTERFNRMIATFDRSLSLPISDGAKVAYARAPIPEVAASDFKVLGGSVYAGRGGASRQLWDNQVMWMPRLGAAYQLNSRTVVRAGYGTYYDSLNAWTMGPNQLGFSRTTSTPITNDFGQTWLVGDPANGISPLTNPFPVRSDGNRYDLPIGDALGSMAVAGTSFQFNTFDAKRAMQHRWRIGVQRQLGASTVIEFAYAGTKSSNVYKGGGWEDSINMVRNLNPLPAKYWATGLTRNDAIASDLYSNVPSPLYIGNFADLKSSNPLVYQYMTTRFTGPNTSKVQLLRPFPQMGGLSAALDPSGQVRTDELDVTFERRFAKGLSVNASYVRFRNRAADVYLNEFDTQPSWREGTLGRPHRLTGMAIIEVPFGKRRKFLNQGVPAAIFGGLQVALSYEYQPGPLIQFPNLFYYGDLAEISKGSNKTLDQWFNTANFQTKQALGPAAFHVRVFPTEVDGVRADGVNLWNTNVQRDFRLTERFTFQLRAEALNLQNRSQFASPQTWPYSTDFGKVSSQTPSYNRFLQFEGRIQF